MENIMDIEDPSEMEYIVDVLGFKKPGDDFVLKELAILCLSDNREPLVWLFKEPFPWKRLTDKYRKENQWLENNSHGIPWIPWSSGNVDYTLIDEIIRETLKDATRIIVRNQVINLCTKNLTRAYKYFFKSNCSKTNSIVKNTFYESIK